MEREVHGSYTCVHCPPEPLDDAYRPTARFGVPTLSCFDEERQMERDRHMSFLLVGGEVDWLGAAATLGLARAAAEWF